MPLVPVTEIYKIVSSWLKEGKLATDSQSNIESEDSAFVIFNIVSTWLKDGGKVVNDTDLPLHPEFIYRKSGEWKGWNDYLNADSKANSRQDAFEELAYDFICTHMIDPSEA
jgi:hypothetical protein